MAKKTTKQAKVDHAAALARWCGQAARTGWHATAAGAGRAARKLPSPHRTSVDLPGHDTAGLALLLTGAVT
ncbi:hypothetical protein, partial [Salinispora mooreana]|uniref:hypothetical protein n=1 Tax=Salinispora mooreana TaxID=999545 RepID=UPI000534D668